MNNDQKVKDIIHVSTSISEIIEVLNNQELSIIEFIALTKLNIKRTDKNLLLFNILRKLVTYIHCLKFSLDLPTEQIAFSTRCVFELNLITRYILQNESQFNNFMFLSVLEEKKILNAFIAFNNNPDSEPIQIIKQEINRLDQIIKKYNIREDIRLPRWSDMAKMLNLTEEYGMLYKWYSNYVHPTPYSINKDSNKFHSDECFNILLTNAQIYSGDTFKRIKDNVMKLQ